MKVRIVCYDDVHDWILRKFAIKMQENLIQLGISVDIDKVPDANADVNHHIIYNQYNVDQFEISQYNKDSINTLMITHIDEIEKLDLLKHNLSAATLGICMSKETMIWLAKIGIEKDKLCYINPAHDNLVEIKKFVIGIACRVQTDGRKREKFIDNLANELNPKYFRFKIMGDSWDPQVKSLIKNGFEVEYVNHFDKDKYYPMITSLDYYLYTGMDEGQMGFIDAAAAGVKTIITSQGYHLDAVNGITHPFTTYEELLDIFLMIQKGRSQLVDSVASWNWFDYTKKHFELWNYLLGEKYIKSDYIDGLNSLIEMSKEEIIPDSKFINKKMSELSELSRSHRRYTIINRIKTEGVFWMFSVLFKKVFK